MASDDSTAQSISTTLRCPIKLSSRAHTRACHVRNDATAQREPYVDGPERDNVAAVPAAPLLLGYDGCHQTHRLHEGAQLYQHARCPTWLHDEQVADRQVRDEVPMSSSAVHRHDCPVTGAAGASGAHTSNAGQFVSNMCASSVGHHCRCEVPDGPPASAKAASGSSNACVI